MSYTLRLNEISTYTPSGQPLCSEVTFDLSPGELVVIDGDNGSGKTTLAKAILGFYPHFKGRIERFYTKASYLPQLGNVQFFLPLTILDVIHLTVPQADPATIFNIGLLQNQESLSRSWNTASGGEKQKALLTRIFLQESEMLLLDEPFNHLDHRARKRVIDLINQTFLAKGAVILITHERVADLENFKRIHLTPHRDPL